MIQKLYSWYGKRTVILLGVLIVALVVALLYIHFGSAVNESSSESVQTKRSVSLSPAGALSIGTTKNYIGTIEAVSKASVQAEAGGRVVSVSTQIGNQVQLGQVLVQLENASERASVTQAEGAYESTLAGAAQSESGVRSAETTLDSARSNAVTTVRNAYTTSNNTLLTKVDVFFSNPRTTIPGLRIAGRGETQYLNAERVYWRVTMPIWQETVTVATTDSDMGMLLDDAEEYTTRMLALVDTLIRLTREQSRDSTLDGQDIHTFTPGLIVERLQLISALSSIKNARSGLENADEGVARAQIASAGSTFSLSDAQTKQALGALQSAQARLAQTVIRAPIGGTVNRIEVEVGDFLGAGTVVAEIVNQNAFEISVYLTESERALVTIGDSVTINSAYEGTVTNIAPAIDSRTQKVQVKIGVDTTELLSGSTALITFDAQVQALSEDLSLLIPVQAIAFSINKGSVLGVVDGRVVAIPVTIGNIRGSEVEIDGIGPEAMIISDARGLIVGQEVMVATE